MASTVFVVHCIDTEGPLHESIEATFERLEHIFHLKMEPSQDLLSRLQKGTVNLGGIERSVQKVLAPELLSYNDTWKKIDIMLEDALSARFRNTFLDSKNNGWKYNWFCVDHVEYKTNPRRKETGYHHIFDHYQEILKKTASLQDGLHFHYHPHSITKQAHHCATHWWASSNTLDQVLCKRIIDRNWFPSANRPGFHVNRPDSHWFLEQYIPFDLASLASQTEDTHQAQLDLSQGRLGDWRRAPKNWTPYHPSHDDYQLQGTCRRWIARCLCSGTRVYLLTEQHVRQAFQEARDGKPVVMAFSDHDYRDIRSDVNSVRDIIKTVAMEYPDVPFVFSEAVQAMREALSLPFTPECKLELELQPVNDKAHILKVRSDQPVFGPQPYLAIKTTSASYHHDNFDFQIPGKKWSYVFDHETLPLGDIEKIGVGVNNAYGTTTVSVLDVPTETATHTYWNRKEQ